jgi:hypothetical protein
MTLGPPVCSLIVNYIKDKSSLIKEDILRIFFVKPLYKEEKIKGTKESSKELILY